jgi:acetaldehyde dehydrogenase/alcohol dehydrogenase
MALLGSLQPHEYDIAEQYLKTVSFPKGSLIVEQGSPGDGCYLIDEGQVRLDVDVGETDTDTVLGYLDPGTLLGEFSLIDGEPRSATAYAHTDVVARFLPTERFHRLLEQHPKIGLSVLTEMAQDLTAKLRRTTEQLASSIATETTPPAVDEMVARAVAAQKAFELWSEERVDSLLHDIAGRIAEQAEELAAATVQETGFGVVADKVLKIRFASLDVYQILAGKPASGLLQRDVEDPVTEIASPMGVVLGLIPVTNPVPTLVFKTLICLKGRNALILSCHRNAQQVGSRAGEIIQDVLQQHGAPVELVQWIKERSSRKTTAMFMRHEGVSFILATGGPSMVKAAYSSGTPAIGVGPGNAPVWVCSDADPKAAARMVIGGKSFDNGVICGSENNLVVDASVREPFIAALKAHGAAVLTSDEIDRFTPVVFDAEKGHLRRELVGQSAQRIAEKAGIKRDDPIRLIVAPLETDRVDGPYGREKLAPILSLFTVDGVAAGLELCKRILNNEGIGHTAVIHTNDPDLVERFGLEMPASRILVNCPGSQGCAGICGGLTPSLTLGCGTLGGTSTTDNVSYGNLLNIKRIAHAL